MTESGSHALDVYKRQYSAAPDAEILANTPQVQAVHFKNAAVTGVTFWQPSANPVAGVSVDAPASVTMREDAEGLTIGVSDPTQLNTGKIRITLDRAVGKPVEEHPKLRVLSTYPVSYTHLYTPSQLVLGWMLALSPCVVPEVTASRLEHLEANLREVDPAHAAVFAEEVASVDSFTVKYS